MYHPKKAENRMNTKKNKNVHTDKLIHFCKPILESTRNTKEDEYEDTLTANEDKTAITAQSRA